MYSIRDNNALFLAYCVRYEAFLTMIHSVSFFYRSRYEKCLLVRQTFFIWDTKPIKGQSAFLRTFFRPDCSEPYRYSKRSGPILSTFDVLINLYYTKGMVFFLAERTMFCAKTIRMEREYCFFLYAIYDK